MWSRSDSLHGPQYGVFMRTRRLEHYRVRENGSSLIYMTDPEKGQGDGNVALCAKAFILAFHDGIYPLNYACLAWLMIASGLATFVILLVGPTAPYGR